MAPIVAATLLRSEPGPSCWRNSACGLYTRTIRSTPVRGLQRFIVFRSHLKGLLVGFTLLSHSYYYLRTTTHGAARPRTRREMSQVQEASELVRHGPT
jgi:hypothetical protein